MAEKETGFFKTKDGTEIFYSYTDAKGDKAVILLHQFRRDHHSYDSFAESLAKEGISSIAIDLRGHGKSIGDAKNPRTWQDFSEEDFKKMQQDVYSARNYLMLKKKKSIFITGASIGANTALNFASENRDIKGIILLSPGLEYHGINTEVAMVRNKVPALIFVSKADEYSHDSSEKIYDRMECEKKIKMYPSNMHGVDMFRGTDMEVNMIKWLKEER